MNMPIPTADNELSVSTSTGETTSNLTFTTDLMSATAQDLMDVCHMAQTSGKTIQKGEPDAFALGAKQLHKVVNDAIHADPETGLFIAMLTLGGRAAIQALVFGLAIGWAMHEQHERREQQNETGQDERVQ